MKINLPHILLVDDDKKILELINDYLNKNNFRVMTAENASIAREKNRKYRIRFNNSRYYDAWGIWFKFNRFFKKK